LNRVFKYRRDVVLGNLKIAFPKKTDEERQQIAKDFYKYFADTFIESIKMISISKRQILKRSSGGFDLINSYVEKGYSINLLAGHQFNWEYGNLLCALNLKIPFTGVYMHIGNKVLNKVFYDIRKRYGTILISAADFKLKMTDVFKEQYLLGLAADQNPADCKNAYWINFFGHPTPFYNGPEKGAIKNNAAVIFVGFKKIKRGYYYFETTLLSEDASLTKQGEITTIYKNQLEKTIEADPANYLWSHRRFKHRWKEEYGEVMG
jgi:KDO2-lipid IV(A) lauroyltransferase